MHGIGDAHELELIKQYFLDCCFGLKDSNLDFCTLGVNGVVRGRRGGKGVPITVDSASRNLRPQTRLRMTRLSQAHLSH